MEKPMEQALYLIAAGPDDSGILDALDTALAQTAPAAILVAREQRSEADYARLALAIIARAQPRGSAVLLDNLPDKVAEWRADGVHLTGGIGALREAVAALKPDFIVGAGDIGSRHEAMIRGELEIDYLMFGDRPGDPGGAEMAAWWAETFEIPAVYCAQGRDDAAASTVGTEFLARPLAGWTSDGGA